MNDKSHESARMKWARFRFTIVGPLLSCPPDVGELREHVEALASRRWEHPTTRESLRYGASTIERWYYAAKNAKTDPIDALARKVPSHAGTRPSLGAALREALAVQYRAHPSWTYALHHQNLAALAKADATLGEVPSPATIARHMRQQGMVKQRRRKRKRGEVQAFEPRERRSFEVTQVHGLWHADFHECSRAIALADGSMKRPQLLAFMDDASRLICHAQWYLDQTTEAWAHGLSQAMLKRGLPRALLTDNGSAMMAAESTEGLARLSIVHHTTLPYTPEQNGKQESFWGLVEGRLMAMLEGEAELTLSKLNEATQAWVELDYHRKRHSELGTTPLERAMRGPAVAREAPSMDVLRRAFRKEEVRTLRRSDGTITIEGVRFEVPARYCVLLRPTVRFARWDLSSADLVDARHGTHLATLLPLDKAKNASGARRPLGVPQRAEDLARDARGAGIAPHLRVLMAEYAATGLPPAYLPLDAGGAADGSGAGAEPVAPEHEDHDHDDSDDRGDR